MTGTHCPSGEQRQVITDTHWQISPNIKFKVQRPCLKGKKKRKEKKRVIEGDASVCARACVFVCKMSGLYPKDIAACLVLCYLLLYLHLLYLKVCLHYHVGEITSGRIFWTNYTIWGHSWPKCAWAKESIQYFPGCMTSSVQRGCLTYKIRCHVTAHRGSKDNAVI